MCTTRSSVRKRHNAYFGTGSQLVGYTDADWAGNAVDRRSTSGYAFSLRSAAIAWSSKK